MEGHSLLPILHGEATETPRAVAICEYDYSATSLRGALGVSVQDARGFMATNRKWKLIHFEGGFRPMLFDLENDPQELVDLGESPDHADAIAEMYGHLNAWFRRCDQRITISTAELQKMSRGVERRGIAIAIYSEDETDPVLVSKYTGRKSRPWHEVVGKDPD